MARKPFTQTCYECGIKIAHGEQIVINENGYFVVYCAQDVPMKAVA
jgi:hypothetical protein